VRPAYCVGLDPCSFEIKEARPPRSVFQDALSIIRISNNLGDARAYHPIRHHDAPTPHAGRARPELGISDGLLRSHAGWSIQTTWSRIDSPRSRRRKVRCSRLLMRGRSASQRPVHAVGTASAYYRPPASDRGRGKAAVAASASPCRAPFGEAGIAQSFMCSRPIHEVSNGRCWSRTSAASTRSGEGQNIARLRGRGDERDMPPTFACKHGARVLRTIQTRRRRRSP